MCTTMIRYLLLALVAVVFSSPPKTHAGWPQLYQQGFNNAFNNHQQTIWNQANHLSRSAAERRGQVQIQRERRAAAAREDRRRVNAQRDADLAARQRAEQQRQRMAEHQEKMTNDPEYAAAYKRRQVVGLAVGGVLLGGAVAALSGVDESPSVTSQELEDLRRANQWRLNAEIVGKFGIVVP